MAGLSKSRLMSFLQCEKRLWLEQNRPDEARLSAATRAAFDTGRVIGELARGLYDHAGTGRLIAGARGMGQALRDTARALADPGVGPLFEATFERDGLLVRVDILERDPARLIEVKSSTAVKDEHVTDAAIQAWVLGASPIRPARVALAHVNNTFVYPGDGDYRGLLREQDLTGALSPRLARVPTWLAAARAILSAGEPASPIGRRCRAPYECPFIAHCWPHVEHPLDTLPGIGSRLDEQIAHGYRDIRELPEALVGGADALRVWRAARSGAAETGAAARGELALLGWPRQYLDFETVAAAIPLWAGTRPYQAIPFQWSLHVERASGQLEHAGFLAPGDELPARAVATELLRAVSTTGPVLIYTSYEKACLNTLADLCPDLAEPLAALTARLVDLHPIVKRNYYHPAMRGSWSIKAVLPTIAPEMDYARLDGVQDGTGAQAAYLEAMAPATPEARRRELREQLLRYCAHDTLAMVHITSYLAGAG